MGAPRILLALALVLLAATAPAILLADRVVIAGEDRLIAEGSVEVLQGSRRLTAARIAYDRSAEQLLIEGPIRVSDGPDSVLLADAAELAPDLSEGLLRAVRLVLEQRLQIAAAEARRLEGGRYLRLERTVASSCAVCEAGGPPLWQIRARRVTHDRQARELVFEHARFEIAGLPVFYLPRLVLPDPSVRRASGFLTPSLRNTTTLGTGVKLPYFRTLGRHADLTITPFLSSQEARALELRYRHAFRSGDMAFRGALARDRLRPGATRAYLEGSGRFTLPREITLDFQIETVSDPSFLRDYGFSDTDRLDSRLTLTSARRDGLFTADLFRLRSLRARDDNATLPNLGADLAIERRVVPALLGGVATLRAEAHTHYRSARTAFDTPADPDTLADGLDMSRLGLGVSWARSWGLAQGVQLTGMAALQADAYAIGDAADQPATLARLSPAASIQLSWPLSRTEAGGAVQLLEPVVALGWSDNLGDIPPNEDSVLVEFDEANLFARSRFPGADAREEGLRAELGLRWAREAPEGWSTGLTLGRIVRADDAGQFAPGTGLSGNRSDWLAALQLRLDNRVRLTSRLLLDDSFNLSRTDMRLGLLMGRASLASTFLWTSADDTRPEDSAEWTVSSGWEITPRWTGLLAWRYDFEASRASRTGVGLRFHNECLRADLSLSRRFASSTSVEPVTELAWRVAIEGFGASPRNEAARRCLP